MHSLDVLQTRAVVPTHLADRIGELLRPEAFQHPTRALRLIETHISWVILAGKYVYKIRKPVNFGFLDFSTQEQRRADCIAEINLNGRLCPDLYIGTVDVVERDGRLFFGGTGERIEPAVQMLRLPDSGMLPSLLERGNVDERLMERIARDLATFHAKVPTGPGVDEFGTVDGLSANWTENFAQTASLAEGILSLEARSSIERFVNEFLKNQRELLERRVREGRIRDGHGDLHAGSVCATPRRIYLFDCVEFSPRYRCADVASDVAFLAMDLEHLGRADLSAAFVDAYMRYTGDAELVSLLGFYKCYRAYVRGKVLGLRLGEPDLQPREVAQITNQARAYFELARTYAKPPAAPVLLVTMGLPATGKSTLARAAAGECALVHLSSDVVRKRLAGLRPTTHGMDAYGRGLYSRSMTRRTYAVMKRKAARWLRRGHSVVLDATFSQPSERASVRLLARKMGARLVVVVCSADESLIRARLASRQADPSTNSDARLDLWPAMRAAFVPPKEMPDAVTVDTAQPLELSLERLVSAVRA